MLKLLFCSLFLLIGGTIYCCIHASTSYDEETDDIEQEKFIKNWK